MEPGILDFDCGKTHLNKDEHLLVLPFNFFAESRSYAHVHKGPCNGIACLRSTLTKRRRNFPQNNREMLVSERMDLLDACGWMRLARFSLRG